MLILLAACAGGPAKDTSVPSTEGFALTTDAHLALPFVTAGDPAPDGEFVVTAVGRASDEAPTLTVEGDFSVDGAEGAFGADEARRYTVRYIGDTSEPTIALGSVTFAADGATVTATLAAVVGDPELPPADWTYTGWGDQATVGLPSAPFPHPGSAYEDDSVLVFVPDALSDRDGVSVVTHLHGWDTALAELTAIQRPAEQLALSGRDAVLIVPQGPVQASDGDFGKLMEPGGHAALVRDVLSLLYRDGYVENPTLLASALTAHSGGYLAAAAILENADLPTDAVHLFDALYGRRDVFAAFAADGGVLRSAYTATGGTDAENLALREDLAALGVSVGTAFTDDALFADTVTVGPVESTHGGVVRDDRAYARWLAASGLPHLPAWPPELVSTISDGSQTVVSWRGDPGTAGLRYRVEGSDNGARWGLLTDTGETTATVPATPWIRVSVTDVRYGDSAPSDAYGGTGAEWLVVDGFDRAMDGSYDYPTHAFAGTLGEALGAPFSVASNEAIASGEVDLSAFPRVLWLLGDEGEFDRTFSERERTAVTAFVEGGGTLVVSGSEVGYATETGFLGEVLHATYVADDAGTALVGAWEVGAAYVEDSPDVLGGDEVLWTWATGEPAAVIWEGRVVVVGFGLENLDELDRAEAFGELLDRLE